MPSLYIIAFVDLYQQYIIKVNYYLKVHKVHNTL